MHVVIYDSLGILFSNEGHQSKETTTPQLTLHTVKAHQSCWGQKLTQTQENMVNRLFESRTHHGDFKNNFLNVSICQLSQVLDSRGSPDERLAYVNNQILTRTDFWTLGRPQDVEGMVSMEIMHRQSVVILSVQM